MPRYRPHEEPPPQPPHDENALRPDQKRCRRCRVALILEQRRCPFCGFSPWYWNPNARFLVISIIIGLCILLLAPLVINRDAPYRTPVSSSP